MLALGIVMAVLLFLALLRIGVRGEYSEDGILIQLKIGAFLFLVYPAKKKSKKKKEKKQKKKTAETKAPADKAEDKKGGSVEIIKKILPEVIAVLKKLKRKICIKRLKIWYMSASDDPAKAALYYGYASAGAGAISAVFENNFKVRRRDIRTSVSFTESQPKVYVDLIMTLAVWEILYIAVPFALKSLKVIVKSESTKA